MPGSIFEHKSYKSKDFPFFGPGAGFTDDTICTIAVAEAFPHGKPSGDALYEWCTRYPRVRIHKQRCDGWLLGNSRRRSGAVTYPNTSRRGICQMIST
ncbi:MAG TPA: hypothetical protein VEG60_30810 [Candidatus Binatia bacterium]|nr:hypothetical protein [Candidatus Binatia bacterium]